MRYISDLITQVVLGYLADIGAVQENGARSYVIKTGDQVHQGRFTRTGRPDKGGGLPGFGSEGDVVEHVLLGARVTEADVTELDHSLERLLKVLRLGRILDNRFGFQHVGDTAGGDRRPGDNDKHERQHQEREHNLDSIL